MANSQFRPGRSYTPTAPWRTRGSFDPTATANAANSNLPVAANDVSISPNETVAPNDSFIVTNAYTYSSLTGTLQTVAVGDRLVYLGGTITSAASWMAVREGNLHPANVRVVSERFTGFSN